APDRRSAAGRSNRQPTTRSMSPTTPKPGQAEQRRLVSRASGRRSETRAGVNRETSLENDQNQGQHSMIFSLGLWCEPGRISLALSFWTCTEPSEMYGWRVLEHTARTTKLLLP